MKYLEDAMSQHVVPEQSSDSSIEQEVSATRREFLQGVLGTLVGASAAASSLAREQPSAPPSAGAANEAGVAQGSAESYPPMLQGIRGQNQQAMEMAHALRDEGATSCT